jgi:hypothetical protein
MLGRRVCSRRLWCALSGVEVRAMVLATAGGTGVLPEM